VGTHLRAAERRLPYGITHHIQTPNSAQTPVDRQAGTRFTCNKGMEGWVDL